LIGGIFIRNEIGDHYMSGVKTQKNTGRFCRKRRFSGITLVVAALTASLSAHAATAQSTDTLTTSYPQEPPSWDYWSVGATAISAATFINVRQPLIEVLEDGSLGPLLAESWDISEDGLTVTFTIREATFSDGTDLDATDVVYSILKNRESPIGSISVPLSIVENAVAVDARTVQLNLSVPSQRLMTELGKRAGIIVPDGAFETLDVAREMVGTGPYIFSEYNPGVDVKLTRNDNYWGSTPYFETVTHRFIADETAAINALLAGDIDVIGGVLGEGLERVDVVDARSGFAAIIPPPLEISYVWLDTTNESLQNDSVRQAIAHGIERETLLIAGQNGMGKTTCQYVVPSNAPWKNEYCPYNYDPARAIELLEAAGVEDLTLYFPYLTVAEFPPLKEVLVSQMAKIGVTLDAKPLDLATWFEQVWSEQGAYDFGSITDGVTIDAFSGQGRAPFGFTHTEVTDTVFNNLVESSDGIVDYDEYLAAMAEMAKVFADSAWIIPLYAKSSPMLVRTGLEGIKPYRTLMEFDLRNVRAMN
jgi:peptide/nickel transport system substrate-binding protein